LPTPATVPLTAVVVVPSEPEDPQATATSSKKATAALRCELRRENLIEQCPVRELLLVHHG